MLFLHNLPIGWRAKKVNLLIASYLFYAAWNPPFVALLWLSTVVDWYVAKALYRAEGTAKRRGLVLVSILVNLGILGFFKYGGFVLENFVALVGSMGIDYHPAAPDIILPVGISFYTFQTMAYSLDVYLRRAAPAKSLLDFSLFVTFFPQLVAGPIVRPTDLIPQFEQPRRASSKQLLWGLGLMTLGIFEKVVLADGIFGPASDDVFGARSYVTFVDAWLGAMAFSGQIFCDFAGYSTTAIGAALCLGFSIPDNFRFPYAAVGFSDFWRRWHISLSTWLRDYLYIPLGGNRKSNVRTYVNLAVTMLLGGLWHGASWTFVVWGGLHGLYLMVERFLREHLGKAKQPSSNNFLAAIAVYLLVDITWVFFRAQDFATAWRLIRSMFGMGIDVQATLPTIYIIETVVAVVAMIGVHWYMRNRSLEQVVSRIPWWGVGLVWGIMLFLIIITQGSGSAFIYFQF
ncbi:MAG TPA: MBOAT family O-acyltransferase [Rhodothermales bacterium]